ncbi:hypothetical protein LUZ63_005006 [Rhynchospora breviuscula]|uniref:Protein kinase domain-containing protein n=1 Tax=Rhynchospora breviuscula TaxID=2022672 RepID=A0A9Q0HS72_9POAL|nr:hypothetical protein LUZ63_005006 [Rhynchospora breviuscula]
MEVATKLKNGISRQLSAGASLSKAAGMQLWRQASALGLARQASANRFIYGRQSSLDPNRREPDPGGSTGSTGSQLSVPENLDSTMQLLFVASHGDIEGVEELLKEGIDVNSIDLDGRTALHIASCEGHLEVVKLLLWWRANINARDRWGSTPAADAKYYGNTEVYDLLRSRGAKVPKTIGKTPMSVANPQDVPEYELNPLHLEFRRNDELSKGNHVAKWNGTKVCVKILDKDALSDPESMGINYLHESKPDPIIHSNLCPKNIFRDNTNRLKVAGFGLMKMTKVSEDEYRFANPVEFSDNSYVAPEVYKNEVFDRGVDAFSFGLILYEMIEGAQAFYPKGAHEVVKMICLEGQRPPFKNKMKSYLSDSKELIQECWDPRPASRPTFSEIISRLSKMDSICVKQSRWKDNFKLPWK